MEALLETVFALRLMLSVEHQTLTMETAPPVTMDTHYLKATVQFFKLLLIPTMIPTASPYKALVA